MKTILMLDEQYIIDNLRPLIEAWGYKLIGLSNPTCIEDAILQNEIDLIILAMQMRVSGPSLEGNFDGNLVERILKLKDTSVNFYFGLDIQTRLRLNGIKLPIIFVSTEDMVKPKWDRTKDGRLYSAIFPKPYGIFSEEFKQTIDEILK